MMSETSNLLIGQGLTTCTISTWEADCCVPTQDG